MHRSSDTIGAIAAALAKAQGELENPEKALTATLRSPFARGTDRTFRYASLASGLDLVRKALGQHEIATVQTTAIDQESGLIRLTTLLAHASGEWIASDWPVCPISETGNPHRMGAALSYARRYALFALVGIAGEDDLDALNFLVEPSPDSGRAGRDGIERSTPESYSIHKPRQPKPVLVPEPSAILREVLVTEIRSLTDGDDLALWVHLRLAAARIRSQLRTRSPSRRDLLVPVICSLRVPRHADVGRWLECQFQAVSMIERRSCRGAQPMVSLASALSATNAGESPSRRGPYFTSKLLPTTSRTVSSSSFTVVPRPVPRLRAWLAPLFNRCWMARVCASARSRTWTKSRTQEPSRVS
jgi:hypothetical protein